jgi:hypothetical protein
MDRCPKINKARIGARNMARARNIKPSFFTNDRLSECHPLARLLFIGLWTIADREGRLEERPKKIKAEILPYDDCDCESLLKQLHAYGFIQRYEVDNIKYIQIVNFTKHQNPHIKEQASTIPAPDLHSASMELARPLTDSLLLIPDSPLLIPESIDSARDKSHASKPKKRATRLPEDWGLPQEWGEWAETQGLSGDEILRQAEKFKDRQQSRGAAYSDWQATWRNWIRNHIEWSAKNVQAQKR